MSHLTTTGNWLNYVDPLISLVCSFFVIQSGINLCLQAFPVLMEASGPTENRNSLKKASATLRNHLENFGLR